MGTFFCLFLYPRYQSRSEGDKSAKNAIFATLNPDMRRFSTYIGLFLTVVFCSYYAGISMFSHTHITNGSSVVHSHLGGGAQHDHSDSQYAVIDILSNFQSECAVDFFCAATPFFLLSESFTAYEAPSFLNEVHSVHALRGPPQA